MGKHGKNNMSRKEVQTVRSKRKDDLKKNFNNFQSSKGLNKQGVELPQLKSHKAAIISDMKNKKVTDARSNLIETLKSKLQNEEQSNNKITMGHLLESSYQGRSMSNNQQYESLMKSIDYYNREEESGFYGDEIKTNKINVDMSKKSFMKDLKKVIESSDVILEVLDARDPMSYRSRELESQILSHKDEKKLILVINKIDLVTSENAQGWKDYLKQEFPCVLFKANTQNQNSNLSNITIYHSSMSQQKDFIDEMINSNKAVGGEDLMNILKNYCRIEDTKKSLVVGIVGFPNVGKSSIINSLKRGKAVGVSSTPGYTKAISEIILDKHIKLLDCPGVVYSSNSEINMLSNILRPEQLEDPVTVAGIIIKKAGIDELFRVYNVQKELEHDIVSQTLYKEVFFNPIVNFDIEQVEKILCLLARRFNKYKQGGLADIKQAALIIVKDWNDGKIKYMTQIPNNYITSDMIITDN